jgi:DNA-binding MarR family transcriptional regulator
MTAVSEISADDWASWRLYFASGRRLVAELDRRLQADVGISHPEYTVLLSLNEAPEKRLRTGELAELLAWEKSRVSHQVTRMEARRLVDRTPCEDDGRGTWIGITTEGRRLLLKGMRDHTAAIRELFFDRLSDEQLTSIREGSIRMLELTDPAAIVAALPGLAPERATGHAAELAPEAVPAAG